MTLGIDTSSADLDRNVTLARLQGAQEELAYVLGVLDRLNGLPKVTQADLRRARRAVATRLAVTGTKINMIRGAV